MNYTVATKVDPPATCRFFHRTQDKLWYSVCLNCFRTVTHERQETLLLDGEASHVCDPGTVERLRMTMQEYTSLRRNER